MKDVYQAFRTDGQVINCTRYGNGHINETYLLTTNREQLYILQKLNGYVFRDLPGVMRNVAAVAEHIRCKVTPPQQALTLVPTVTGEPFLVAPDGTLWRMYEFISGGVCLEQAQTQEDFRAVAEAFGQFQNQLADFPAETLTETIPHFTTRRSVIASSAPPSTRTRRGGSRPPCLRSRATSPGSGRRES